MSIKQVRSTPLVFNPFAGPGAGKSSTAAEVFANLKRRGVICELVREYAKDVVWEKRENLFANQYYIFAKQLQYQMRLIGKVDVIVTDSPILLSVVYNHRVPAFNDVVLAEFNLFDNLNFYIERVKPYVQVGRYQDEAGARNVDTQVRDMLDSLQIPYESVPGIPESAEVICERILARLHEPPKELAS